MATTIGLPSLTITFQAAAQQAANRSKKGYVGVFVRDAKAQGVHQLSSAALIPTELGQDNQDYIKRAFTGSDRGGPSKVVAVVIATGTEDTTALEAGLKSIEGLTLDYLAGPPDATAAELTALEKWVKDRRAAYFTEKLVEPNAAKAPDDMGIIDFAETDGAIAEGEATYTAGQYASRIAGVLAGIPAGMSATYAPLTELTAVTPRSTQEQEAAIKAGKLILIHDGVKAKIARGVNSLTTIPAAGKADWRKIKIVEGMDLLTYYLRTTIQDQYVGRYANTYDNKCVLVTAIQTFLAELEGQGVLSSGESWAELDVEAQERWMRSQGIETADMTAQEIKEYQTGSWVFVRVGGRFVDAMEDFQLSVDNLPDKGQKGRISMARTIDSARRVISGTWGEVWLDGEKVAEASAGQAKVALNKETVNLCGRFMAAHKATSASGTGSLTLYKVDSGFAQRMEGIQRGVDRRFTLIFKLRDPDSYGAERVALYDVSFDDLTLADWKAATVGSVTAPFTFSDYEYLDQIEVQ